MKLADTHTILWLTEDESLLSKSALSALAEARMAGGIALSAMSLMEIARLEQKGRISLRSPILEYLKHLEKLCVVLPINADISALAVGFSSAYPRDPADRIIGATAVFHKIPLVTKDEGIRASNEVPCIW